MAAGEDESERIADLEKAVMGLKEELALLKNDFACFRNLQNISSRSWREIFSSARR